MLGSKLSFHMARLGTLCTALAVLVFVAGCPFIQQQTACTGNPCDDSNACTEDSCALDADAPDGRVCTNANNTTDCDDGDACTDGDVCADGACAGAAIDGCCESDADCDDGNDCTDDACDTETATCSNANNTADCDDGNDCTSGDVCADGACAGANTTDACDDGDVCTDGDVCADGACAGTAIDGCCNSDADCPEGDVCTANVCETPTPDCTAAADCDDDDFCTDDACVDNSCVFTPITCASGEMCDPTDGNCVECLTNADCDDGVGCTVDACSGNACSNIQTDALCDDNAFCTGAETCDPDDEDADVDGCVSAGDPCTDGTVATGKICDEIENDCDDCTSDAECDDGVPCTDDSCGAGTCANANTDANCPDPANCDGVDVCDPADADADADGCVQPGNPCDPKLCDEATYDPADNPGSCTDCTANTDCDDGVTCTDDTCDGATGDCAHADDDALCPDALFCDGVDTCASADADADADGCILGALACANACNEGTDSCFDCTANADCDDFIDCTDDTCDGASGACTGIRNDDNCAATEVCDASLDGCVTGDCVEDADCATTCGVGTPNVCD